MQDKGNSAEPVKLDVEPFSDTFMWNLVEPLSQTFLRNP